MSLPIRITSTCSVCGTESTQTVLASTSRFGSPDLDLRPPQMMRSTMAFWLAECPKCGYVASSLSDACPVPAAFLHSTAYQTCNGVRFHSPLAHRFYRSCMIHTQSRSWKDAMRRALETAWICDDVQDTANAVFCRNLAAASMELVRRDSPRDETLMIQQLDILRRAGRFDEAIAAYEQMKKHRPGKQIRKLAAFEVEKARQHDPGCYTVADALE